MKFVVVFFVALIALGAAAPQAAKDAVILKWDNDNIGVDGYKFAYETSNGQSRTEVGEIQNAGTDNEILKVHGSISWVDDEGTPFNIDFTADENGFKPAGSHLPKTI